MKKEWKTARGKYAYGEELWIGRIVVGSWFSPPVTKGADPIFRAACQLPGLVMKPETTDFPDREQAKVRLERAVDVWFKWLNEEPSNV